MQRRAGINACIIKRHIESSKHNAGKEMLAQRKKRDISIEEAMEKYYQEVHPVGEVMSDNQLAYRVRVLKGFLKEDVPLNTIDDFRELLLGD